MLWLTKLQPEGSRKKIAYKDNLIHILLLTWWGGASDDVPPYFLGVLGVLCLAGGLFLPS